MDEGQKATFDGLKAGILAYFNINTDTFRRRYQEETRTEGESWIRFYRKFTLTKKWLKDTGTMDEVMDITSMQNVILKVLERLGACVRDQQPKMGSEAMHMADSFISN